jgi:eukaryotic-like serine/threonine-protein kinase
VYRVRDPQLAREVAIRVLPEALADDAAAPARFEREARSIAALSHPNILATYDVDREGRISYVVTELLGGGERSRDRIPTPRALTRQESI